MEQESLNIEEHIKPMILKALNSSCCKEGAARKLGINKCTLDRWQIQYNIVKIGKRKYAVAPPQKKDVYKKMRAAV